MCYQYKKIIYIYCIPNVGLPTAAALPASFAGALVNDFDGLSVQLLAVHLLDYVLDIVVTRKFNDTLVSKL